MRRQVWTFILALGMANCGPAHPQWQDVCVETKIGFGMTGGVGPGGGANFGPRQECVKTERQCLYEGQRVDDARCGPQMECWENGIRVDSSRCAATQTEMSSQEEQK